MAFTTLYYGHPLSGTAGAAITAPSSWNAFRGAAAQVFLERNFTASAEYRLRQSHSDFAASGLAKIGERFSLSAGAAYLGGDLIGDYRTSNAIASVGAAFALGDYFSVGANGRYAKQNLSSEVSYSAFSVDASLYGSIGPAAFTVGLCGIGPAVTSASGDTYSQPANMYAGASCSFGEELSFALDAEGEYYFSGNWSAAAGMRALYASRYSISCGYRFSSPLCVVPSQFALGAGVEFDYIHANLSFIHFTSASLNMVSIGVTVLL